MDDSLPHRSSRDADRCRPARCPGSSGYRRRGHIPCHIPPEVPGATRPDRRRRSRCVPRPRHRPDHPAFLRTDDERARRRVRRPPARRPRRPRRRCARRPQLGGAGPGYLEPARRHAGSFTVFCRRTGWLQVDLCAGLERRPERTDRTKAVADTSLERLFRREDVPVREKCLWRLLYETAARAQEVLSLDVEDVDLDNKRARTVSKGGDTEWLHFQSGSARLLPRVIAGRQTGPLFLADRRPAPARTPGCPRRLPRHRPGTTVLRTRRVPVQAALPADQPQRIDPAPAPALGPDHPRRRQRLPAAADGQEPPQEPAITAALRSPLRRSRRRDDRAHDPAARRRRY